MRKDTFARAGHVLTMSVAKTLGAFYTDQRIANFLVRWAIRTRDETVMDPAFGDGVFLDAAATRLLEIGGRPDQQVFGVEIDSQAYGEAAPRLRRAFGLTPHNLLLSDFFATDSETGPRFDAVVGNPPFIRYQRFNGENRKRALALARRHGVRLSELSSSWAPFLVHSIASLNEGGRLAMVMPFELTHASYAKPLLHHLRRSFGAVTFITFRKKLFPDLSEDTLLVLASGREDGPGVFKWVDLTDINDLPRLQSEDPSRYPGLVSLDAQQMASGQQRLSEYMLPPEARTLYAALKASKITKRLGEIADVGIGYVTGNNSFFHLSSEDAIHRGIPAEYLKRSVYRPSAFSGLRFTDVDWEAAGMVRTAGYLLHIAGDAPVPPTLAEYLEEGRNRGVHQAYKCRTRTPWYTVPFVFVPDAFLSYMSAVSPRLVANHASAVAPNTLHVLRMHPLFSLAPEYLAVLALTSLTRLSAEVEGHPLGGGMLKLEPTEAEKLLIPCPTDVSFRLQDIADEVDSLLRRGADANAARLADRAVLEQGIGISSKECATLRQAAAYLQARRVRKNPEGASHEPC